MSPEESGITLKDLQTILVKQNNIIKEKAEAKSQAGAAKTPATSVNNLLF